MSFLKKSTWISWLQSWPVVALLVVIIVLLGKSSYERWQMEREMRERRAAAEIEKAELMERHAVLEERIDYLTGERGVEEEIRQQFDVAKPGEQVIILTGEPLASSTDKTIEAEEEVVPWYQFWR